MCVGGLGVGRGVRVYMGWGRGVWVRGGAVEWVDGYSCVWEWHRGVPV